MNKQIVLILIALIVITISSIMGAYHFSEKYKNEKHDKQNVLILNSRKIKEIEYYNNKNNELIAKNEALELEYKTVRKTDELNWTKKFEGLKKDNRNLEFAYKIQLQINDSLRSKLQFVPKTFVDSKGDTSIFQAFIWGKSHKFGYDSLIQITPDSVIHKEQEIVPLRGVMYWERKIPILWILSKKQYSAELYSENQDVKVTELLNIKIKKK